MSSDPLARQQLYDHFKNPQNNQIPEIYDLKNKQFNRSCGDEVQVYIKLNLKNTEDKPTENKKSPHKVDSLESRINKKILPSSNDSTEIGLIDGDNRENTVVASINFVVRGCALSISSASILSEDLKNMTIGKILNLKDDYVSNLLEIELSPNRIKCALLPIIALKEALRNYRDENINA